MSHAPFIAEGASLIGDPARANMLDALMDGRALTAGELGIIAGVAPSTASGHLAKLTEGGLVVQSSSGRHRYYRLASPAVARVLESLMALAAKGPPRHRPKTRVSDELARARTCYDHFAGRLGVAIAENMARRHFILLGDDEASLTESGREFLAGLGINLETGSGSRRPLCRACLDWSERRFHVAGTVGAAIASHSFEAGWTERHKHGRAVTITSAGEKAFGRAFEFVL